MAEVRVNGAVEGPTDEAAWRRLVAEAGGAAGSVYVRGGRSSLRERIQSYNQAAARAEGPLWFVLVDLDASPRCPSKLVADWLPSRNPRLVLRVVVRELEAWLLADRQAVADWLGVAPSRIPPAPEQLADPKQQLVNLARGSRSREPREGLVPRAESTAPVGPTYTSLVEEFVRDRWRPDIAREIAPSLARCQQRLRALIQAG